MAENNPSIVNDASGSNYNISSGGTMGQAQMQYLENLQRLAMKASPKPLSNNEYFPGENQGIEQGRVNGSIIGSQPLFAASNLIPFAMMDEARRSQAEAEAEYYTKLKPYLDKPLIDAKLKLANPWAQPEFASKIQDVTDKVVESYANKLGGNYMMAQVAASQDKDYNRTLQRFGEYANIYGSVYTGAMETLTKANDPLNYYVSPAQIKSITEFVHAHDSLETLSIDQLAKKGEEYQAKDSIFKLAEAATAKIKEDVVEDYKLSPSMSTQQEAVWMKTKITGSKGQAEEILANVVKANPWLKEDSTQYDLLKTEINNQVKFGVEKSIDKITKDNAARDQELTKYGIRIDPQGVIQFPTKPSLLTGNIGVNAVNYKIDKNQPIPTTSNMQVYIRDKGTVKRVTLPGSYNMIPTSEYDLVDENMPVAKGRYIEGKVTFQGTESYTPENERALTKGGVLVGTYTLGQGKSSAQVVPVKAVDDVGNVVELMGDITVLAPFESMKGQIESIPYMGYVHDKLEAITYPAGGRRSFDPKGNATKEGSRVIVPPDDAALDYFKDDPDVFYNWGGQVLSGKFIHENAK